MAVPHKKGGFCYNNLPLFRDENGGIKVGGFFHYILPF